MDVQYKVLFLKNLIDSAIDRINVSPQHRYKSEINTDNGNLLIKITYNDIGIFSKKYYNLNAVEMYFRMTEIVEKLIACEFLYRTTEKDNGKMSITSGHI